MSEPSAPLDTYRQIRLDKVNGLRVLGIDPYPSDSCRTHNASQVRDGFAVLDGSSVTVAGRLMSWRKHRVMTFADLQDQSGRIQLLLTPEGAPVTVPTEGTLAYDDADRFLDIGDIIEAQGNVTKTRRGEISVDVKRIRILAKSLRPLPDKWHKVTDSEVLSRQRYLDMIMNPDKRDRFRMVSDIQSGIRDYMRQNDFIEFNTPVLQPLYGGGRARPFRTYCNALSTEFYLAISHELYLKRLIVAGFERVYTIGRYFRNEGIDRTHNPEFSMLETMTAFENYLYNMDLTERLYKFLASDVVNKPIVMAGGHEIKLTGEWERAHMADLVAARTKVDFRAISSLEAANEALSLWGLPPEQTIGHAMVTLFEERVTPSLIQPTIVYGHPVEVSPLAKASADDPRFAERFELYINGSEQGDNWSELNDPVELAKRFEAEDVRRKAVDDEEAHPIDHDFVDAVEFGMPPTTGLGPGIERLAMLLTEADAIDDVMFFPLLRPRPPTA